LKRFLLFSLVLLFIFQASAISQGRSPSPQTHFYLLEYERGEKVKCHNLIATFFVKVSPQQAEDILRSELNFIIKNFPPQIDILATAWYSTSSDVNEGVQIKMPNGKNLAYLAKSKKIDYL